MARIVGVARDRAVAARPRMGREVGGAELGLGLRADAEVLRRHSVAAGEGRGGGQREEHDENDDLHARSVPPAGKAAAKRS